MDLYQEALARYLHAPPPINETTVAAGGGGPVPSTEELPGSKNMIVL